MKEVSGPVPLGWVRKATLKWSRGTCRCQASVLNWSTDGSGWNSTDPRECDRDRCSPLFFQVRSHSAASMPISPPPPPPHVMSHNEPLSINNHDRDRCRNPIFQSQCRLTANYPPAPAATLSRPRPVSVRCYCQVSVNQRAWRGQVRHFDILVTLLPHRGPLFHLLQQLPPQSRGPSLCHTASFSVHQPAWQGQVSYSDIIFWSRYCLTASSPPPPHPRARLPPQGHALSGCHNVKSLGTSEHDRGSCVVPLFWSRYCADILVTVLSHCVIPTLWSRY